MQVISDNESESLEEWAVVGYGGEGSEGVEIETKLKDEKASPMDFGNSLKPIEIPKATEPVKPAPQQEEPEMTIMLDLDDETDEDDDDDI